MRVSKLSGYRELLYAALIVFSAVSLSSLEFMKNAFPAADAVYVSKTTVIYLIVLVQVLPALLLLCADRLIAARDSSGRRLRVFRSVLFVVAVVLILRQLQLYWGPGEGLTDSVSSLSSVLLALVELAILAVIIGLAIWLFRGLAMFFAYMSPVAIAMTVLIPFQFQVPTGPICDRNIYCVPDTYGQEVVTASQSESQPAVFILVFDQLGYDVFLQERGELDTDGFPNIAALAEDGVWFTNATTNYFYTLQTLKRNVINPVKSLAEHFDVRLYTQFRLLEHGYNNDCGIVMTCRGAAYLTENNQLRLAGNLALRSFYQATPKPVDRTIRRPMGWLLDRLGWPFPPLDREGIHTFTKRQFDVFLDDIKGREALGRIHVLHLMLPHYPLAFNAEGKALSSGCSCAAGQDFQPEKYRQQSMYTDVLVGKLISKLKREGIYDDSVIVITGDHGPRPFNPTIEKPPEEFITNVPLVIRAPGLNSGVSDVDYQHVDFSPTLRDILGLPPPDDTEGVSAFNKDRPQRDKVFHAGHLRFIYSREDGSWRFSPEE